jgi:hypothetical protein
MPLNLPLMYARCMSSPCVVSIDTIIVLGRQIRQTIRALLLTIAVCSTSWLWNWCAQSLVRQYSR